MMFVALLLAPAAAGTCDAYAEAEAPPPVTGSPIVEASGLVALRTRPGVWLTHNDAGGSPELYAFTLEGGYLETYPVGGAELRDWEDVAAGPCPGGAGDCVYVGDIGDNARQRDSITVYAVAEPAAGAAEAPVVATWTATYPGEPQDSEALAVHPCTGRIYLFVKDDRAPVEVYRLPAEPGEGPLELAGYVDLSASQPANLLLTGADWDPDGERLALRTYADVFEWRADPAAPDGPWGAPPDVHLPAGGGQFESIAYDLGGDLVSLSEGEEAELRRWTCLGYAPDATSCGQAADTGGDPPPQIEEVEDEAAGKRGCRGAALLLLPFFCRRRR